MIAAAARALACCAALAAGPAVASGWRVDSDASSIRFVYRIDGRAAEGAFRVVRGAGTFDPARPEASRLELTIDVASLDLGDALLTGFALGPEWFDAATHPDARYRLVRLTPLPDGRWEALGDLTIRDELQIVRTPVALTFADGAARAVGEVAFNRRDFGVGFGPSTLLVEVAPEVSVRFDLIARPAPADAP